MVVALAYSHTDIHQAAKLACWIAFLAQKSGRKIEHFLLVPSRRVASRTLNGVIIKALAGAANKVYIHVPKEDCERGWPESPNFMFKEALEYVERNLNDDTIWLEPDSIPLYPEWYAALTTRWGQKSGAVFMGNFVHHVGGVPHMTGVGIYGKSWRIAAPKIAEVSAERGWDTDAAEQILANATITNLIQHVWRKGIPTLADLAKPAVIYHQDKTGRFIDLLDKRDHNGECEQKFKLSEIQPETMDMKYYFADNSCRAIRSNGHKFIFDPVDQIGGTWRGVFASQDEVQIVALDTLAADPRTGVREISGDDYERLSKKKVNLLKPSAPSKPQPKPQKVALVGSGNVVVAESRSISEPVETAPVYTPKVENLDDFLVIGDVKPKDPIPEPVKRKKKKGS